MNGVYKPDLRNIDDATTRRFNLAPFLHKPATVDNQLEEKLKAEWPQILRWLIEGCLDWLKNGLIRPDVIKNATAAYFNEQDITGQWIEDCCDVASDIADTKAALNTSMKKYAADRGEDPMRYKAFIAALVKRGFPECRDTEFVRGRGLHGIRVRAHFETEEPPPRDHHDRD